MFSWGSLLVFIGCAYDTSLYAFRSWLTLGVNFLSNNLSLFPSDPFSFISSGMNPSYLRVLKFFHQRINLTQSISSKFIIFLPLILTFSITSYIPKYQYHIIRIFCLKINYHFCSMTTPFSISTTFKFLFSTCSIWIMLTFSLIIHIKFLTIPLFF